MPFQLGGDRAGKGDQPPTGWALGGALDHLAGGEAQALAADSDEHHGPVSLRDSVGEAVMLGAASFDPTWVLEAPPPRRRVDSPLGYM